MKIPFFTIDRQYHQNRERFLGAIDGVLSHGRVLQGPEVLEFEDRLSRFFGVPYAISVGSGTDALVLAMQAMGLQPGDRVAVPAMTFVASASAVVMAGGVPVFVDVEEDLSASREKLLALIEERSIQGIVGVHIFGQMMDLEDVTQRAKEMGIFVLEDAAQALGSSLNGKTPGQVGDAAVLSFDPMKVVGAFGSGGAVVTRSKELAEGVRRLRYHGQSGSRVYESVGRNSQLHTLQAAVLCQKMELEERWRLRRKEIARAYGEILQGSSKILPLPVTKGGEHVFHKYVVRIPVGRDEVKAALSEAGIGTSIHYARPLHQQPCFAKYGAASLPSAEKASQEVLSLPIFPELTDDEMQYIALHLKRLG